MFDWESLEGHVGAYQSRWTLKPFFRGGPEKHLISDKVSDLQRESFSTSFPAHSGLSLEIPAARVPLTPTTAASSLMATLVTLAGA